MASFTKVTANVTQVLATHINQFADALSGTSAATAVAIALTKLNSATEWALSVKNNEATASKGLIVYKSDDTVLLQVDVNGVLASPDGTAATGIVTEGGTQDLTGKTYAATKTGATAGARFVGGTTSGAPASGTFAVGDLVVDQTGKIYIATVAGTPGTWSGIGALSTASTNLAADVSMPTANTFYDGPSVSLTAGTWFVTSTVTLYAGAVTHFTAKLWNATTVTASTQERADIGGGLFTLSMSGIVTLAATETWKVSVAPNSSSAHLIKAAATENGAGNNASHIRAVKVA